MKIFSLDECEVCLVTQIWYQKGFRKCQSSVRGQNSEKRETGESWVIVKDEQCRKNNVFRFCLSTNLIVDLWRISLAVSRLKLFYLNPYGFLNKWRVSKATTHLLNNLLSPFTENISYNVNIRKSQIWPFIASDYLENPSNISYADKCITLKLFSL